MAREPARSHAGRQDAARETVSRRQAALLAALWPGRVAVLSGEPGAVGDWAEADRLYVWMRALVRGAGLPGVDGVPVALPPELLAPPRTSATLPPARAANATLADAPVKAEDVPDVFAPPAEGFSWPATGPVAAAFAPADNPPRQGLVLAVPEGTPVTAAAAGRVVFTGALMGLGRVLILSHGGRRHTVYACLGRLDAAEGDLLEGGAVLGQAGYCGPIRKPGVYFELRFREKALNPAEWFAVRR
ncbi:Peptidase M23 [Solidesulfovibrio fructosivorans JJ]]|uniref:Peptidase M23 n=1 Tax=Solidesulfovibrio fructosivorans JJ] TaxID=596151 RepID=E1JUG7_SOLFR|nr:Peptidase M23 [Solidesulfovibrio fructosivorans JJ]]